MSHDASPGAALRLQRDVDRSHDHVRGALSEDAIVVVAHEDFSSLLPPPPPVYQRLRDALGDRLVYVFRHFPNERAHPSAELAARAAEAAARQGRFDEMHDLLFRRDPTDPTTVAEVVELARSLSLDIDRFQNDLESQEVRERPI